MDRWEREKNSDSCILMVEPGVLPDIHGMEFFEPKGIRVGAWQTQGRVYAFT
jgi:hypothetical protein